MTNDEYLNYLIVIVLSFISSFTINLNILAKSKRKISTLLFISEIFLHGISGMIVGIVVGVFFKDQRLQYCAASVGGLMGVRLVIFITQMILALLIRVQLIKIDDIQKIVNFFGEKK